MVNDRAEQILRIRHYEAILDELLSAVAEAERANERLASLREKAEELERYYTGGVWRRDFADDEKGLLPADLKRGVLSEDGIWNALSDYRELSGEE